ncbi:MAG: 3-dehydroquinate synthase [Pseudomonadota bacterium]|nr:3-dehydroquinate synthase [Pseudomonadota bacterium]
MNSVINFTVALGKKSYPIFIGEGLLKSISDFIPKFNNYSKIILVTDKNIYNKNSKAIDNSLLNILNLKKIVLPSGEKTKSFKYLEDLVEKILYLNIDRNALLICLGGGVIGDLVGLTSSLILRGIDFVQIPTTLLSQVDSSVGGKTGINSRYGKNLVGTFNQPKSVIISIDLLKTLEKRELISGYAEILKYSFIRDKRFFNWLKINGKKIISLEKRSCIYAIKKSCLIKADIVSVDEKEKGIRELLNFGHTFGHAIESISGFSEKLKHGESVFLGMFLAIKFSIYLKLCNEVVLENYISHLKSLNIFFKVKDFKLRISPKDFLKHIRFDKKVRNKKIKFILLKDIGQPVSFFLENELILLKFLENELK